MARIPKSNGVAPAPAPKPVISQPAMVPEPDHAPELEKQAEYVVLREGLAGQAQLERAAIAKWHRDGMKGPKPGAAAIEELHKQNHKRRS